MYILGKETNSTQLFFYFKIFIFSPSGIQLQSKDEIRDYLLTEGTCKCGLDCPLMIETAFNFDHKVVEQIILSYCCRNNNLF